MTKLRSKIRAVTAGLRLLGPLLAGITVGASLVIYIESGRRTAGWEHLIVFIAGLGVAAAISWVLFKVYVQTAISRWNSDRITTLLNETLQVLGKAPLADANGQGLKTVTEIARLIVAFLGAAAALGTVVGMLASVIAIATLLSSYVQIERMEDQNELFDLQNTLIIAQRMDNQATTLLERVGNL